MTSVFSSPASRLPRASIEDNCSTSACFCCFASFTCTDCNTAELLCCPVRPETEKLSCSSMSDSNHHGSCCRGVALGLKTSSEKPCSRKLDSSRSSSFSKIPTFRKWYTSPVGPKFPCIEACNCSKRLIASSARMRDFVKALCKTATIRCSSTSTAVVVVVVARMALTEVVSRLETC